MKLKRLFDYDEYKGTKGYLKTQSKYEIGRTCLYFAISLSLFVAGIIATGDKMNLLTIVAVLGCLPACKSAVTMIMFLRYKGCSLADADKMSSFPVELTQLWDLVFTTYDKNYAVDHAVVHGNTVILYTTQSKMDEQALYKHLQNALTLDGIKNVSFKVFTDSDKYMARANELTNLEKDVKVTESVCRTLCSISL